jgi:hypothetical protein
MSSLSAVRYTADNDDLDIDINFDESAHTANSINLDDVYEVIKTEIIRPISLRGSYSFKFELMNVVTGEMAVLFFNISKTKNGYSVLHKGKFAKLYRLTIGENPKARYSKADQLRSHFIGLHLKCKTEPAKYSDGDVYMKAVEAKPLKPIIHDGWTATGELKGTSRRCRSLKNATPIGPVHGNKMETHWKKDGNELEKEWKNIGNDNTPQTIINTRLREEFQSQITVQGNADNGRADSRSWRGDSRGGSRIESNVNTIPCITLNTVNGYNFRQMPTETQAVL